MKATGKEVQENSYNVGDIVRFRSGFAGSCVMISLNETVSLYRSRNTLELLVVENISGKQKRPS
jgi:hypothetical protein